MENSAAAARMAIVFSRPIQRVNYRYHSTISNNLLGRTINFFETGLPTEHSVEMVVESVVCVCEFVYVRYCTRRLSVLYCVDQTRASVYFSVHECILHIMQLSKHLLKRGVSCTCAAFCHLNMVLHS